MADVQLLIGGQRYTVSCGAGQEGNLKELARRLDEKVSVVKSSVSVSEGLGLVMGSLLLINELDEELQGLSLKQKENEASEKSLLQTVERIEKISGRISDVAETIENA